MKKLFVLIGLIGVINMSSGFMVSSFDNNDNDASIAEENIPLTPMFITLDGNMFLAIKTEGQIEVDDGDVVEFIFDKKIKLVSFHVNDANQDVIDNGEANIFVMIPGELALSLKSRRLQEIKVIHNGSAYSLTVNRFWTPDQFMSSL